MYILGITSPIHWNSAAAIVKDGVLLACAEEERFNRIKHAPRTLPLQAITYCLQAAGITLDQVDYIAVGGRDVAAVAGFVFLQSVLEGRFMNAFGTLGGSFEQWILEYRAKHSIARQLTQGARGPRWAFLSHHVAHAASAFYCSGFDKANLLTLDGNGEADAGYLGFGDGARIRRFEKVTPRDSLGYFYGQVTDLLGFRPHSEEGKTMGLAGWGDPLDDLHDVILFTDTRYRIRRDSVQRLFKAYGPPRRPTQELTARNRNFAASAQRALERAGVTLARRLHRISQETRWCMAGGVALNCDMNARILSEPFVEQLFIQPAAHDGGTALGAAMALNARLGGASAFVRPHAYWGPEYTNEEIAAVLKEAKVPYERCQDIESEVASRLARGQIVGWFQGRMEIGPRALGNRSILANPSDPSIKDRVNRDVKHREPWRPFAPSVLAECAADYFEGARPSPFMLLTFTVKPSKRTALTSAIHVDHTARVQTVTREANPRFYRLIQQFGRLTGVPAVLNTSFNDKGEPLVASPRDALRTFYATGLDALAIGDFLLTKPCIS